MSDSDATTTTTTTIEPAARRPIAARNTRWAGKIAAWLVQRGVTPNAISIASVGVSAIGGAALLGTRYASPALDVILFLLAAATIQLRLLCNMLDGMVAVEGGKGGKAGEVFNDVPDRIADVISLVCAGYAAGGSSGMALGWLAAPLAVMTAYARVLGRSLGAGIYFIGPMAKPHRMATLTAACVFASVGGFWRREDDILVIALTIICIGSAITVARRTRKIIHDLETRP